MAKLAEKKTKIRKERARRAAKLREAIKTLGDLGKDTTVLQIELTNMLDVGNPMRDAAEGGISLSELQEQYRATTNQLREAQNRSSKLASQIARRQRKHEDCAQLQAQ